MLDRYWRIGLCGLVVAVSWLAMECKAAAQPGAKFAFRDRPLLPGFERFYSAAGADAVKGGQFLLGELNCLSCHRPETAPEPLILRKTAPLLDNVGGRIKRGYLRQFLGNPQASKAGTTMPHLLADLPEQERKQKVEALVHFLATTGSLPPDRPDRKLVAQGRDLYHKVGCVGCHATRNADGGVDQALPTSVPMAKTKYSLASLAAFLENPHQVRPSGRMPGLLKAEDAKKVANYLLQGTAAAQAADNMTFAYYEGHWDKLPDFAKLKPLLSGKASDFDVSVARRPTDMALKFEGFLGIDADGDYRFFLASDDGSKLWVNDQLVVSNDGVHATQTQSGAARLTKGRHKLQVGVFNLGGPVELRVDIEGPNLKRQPASPLVFLTPAGPQPKPVSTKKDEENFPLQPELIAQGRELFAALGCASCHQLKINNQVIEAKLSPPSLARLRSEGGCLDQAPKKGVPWYSLSPRQRQALAAAIKTPLPATKPAPAEVLARSLTAFNCYGCHERDKIGGPEETMNPFFTTTQPEMGDEGRIPPSLTGAGAKLTTAFLKQILDKGGHDRPYMHTHMPRFGDANVGHLVSLFQALDQPVTAPRVAFKQAPAKVKAEARHMVGGSALGCIKCHTFAGHKAEGVQGIDMTLMTQRLQRDWFYSYLLNPYRFRPGTRMPTAWPGGQTLLPKVFDGDTPQQIEAIWVYLADGSKAQLPPGMKKQSIPLVPEKAAIIYRNFIEGAGPRAIAVGFPEKAHLAFDANELRLALIWQGDFLDAARHWTDRGAGFEPPLGDNILHLPTGVSFAVLAKEEEAWPQKPARELGYQFRGYRLAADQRPTFRYSFANLQVEDTPNAVAGKSAPALRRTLVLTGAAVDNLWFRAALGNKIEAADDGWYCIDDWKIRLQANAGPRIRQSNGKAELLVPVRFHNGRAQITLEMAW